MASVPDLPGCFSDAPTVEEAEVRIREAITLWIETAVANGWQVPPPRAQALRIAV
ncbi:MAG: type II toxin-antitoxin system HicB family antitoxin [Armatimonadetes bacterium]|nr:type II toxin-antitoxin system HicB family antitoxin [Armatimonadota bacterium]